MPYLDLRDPEHFTHLLQLFFAAHPHYRHDNEAMRQREGLPDDHFLSVPMIAHLARWARERHLIARKEATRLRDMASLLTSDDPAPYFPLTPRVLGHPPRLQPTVLLSEVYGWLYLHPRATAAENLDAEMAFTIEAACAILTELMNDPTQLVADPEQAAQVFHRARRLWAWLRARQKEEDPAP